MEFIVHHYGDHNEKCNSYESSCPIKCSENEKFFTMGLFRKQPMGLFRKLFIIMRIIEVISFTYFCH